MLFLTLRHTNISLTTVPQDIPMLPLLMFLHLHGHVSKLLYNSQCDLLTPTRRAADPLDPVVFNVGLSTILRQVVFIDYFFAMFHLRKFGHKFICILLH